VTFIVDKKYINLVSPQLDMFRWKRDNLANLRCPICGDSQRNKARARGYFYVKSGSFFYRCHNCGVGYNIYNFLEHVDANLAKQYIVEKFKDEHTTRREVKMEDIEFDNFGITFSTTLTVDGLQCVTDLDENHICYQYVKSREIPESKLDRLYYAPKFCEFAQTLDPNFNADGKIQEHDRLVIPVFDENLNLVGVQGRDLRKSGLVKYLTVKNSEFHGRMIYGMDTVNKKKMVYIVEGPIDSLFIDNAIATMNAPDIDPPTDINDCVYVFDNEPRNREIVHIIEKTINKGYKVCIWPETILEKDINDMSIAMGADQVKKIIDNNISSGLEAMLQFKCWRKYD